MRAKLLSLYLAAVVALTIGAVGFWTLPTEAQTSSKQFEVIGQSLLNADAVDQCFYMAQSQVRVVSISEIHQLAATDGGAISLQITKDTGTDVPGGGTNILQNGTSAVGFDVKGTANTRQVGLIHVNATLTPITITPSLILLNPGDRLCMDYSAAPTTTTGVVVSVLLEQLL